MSNLQSQTICFQTLRDQADRVRAETLKLHKRAPETRLASSLSDVEIFVVLFYGGILNYDPQDVYSEDRDRLIISKGHGAISLYPILADLNFFAEEELGKINTEGCLLGVIPDNAIAGFETVNGSLGQGLGVACGIAVAMKRKALNRKVFVLCGDGELNSGAVWEAIMFAAHHRLNNLTLIVDNNRISMLDYQKNILGLEPLQEKFAAFRWNVETADGHNIEQLYEILSGLKAADGAGPNVLIADTLKGKGVPALENDSLCHIKSLRPHEIDNILAKC